MASATPQRIKTISEFHRLRGLPEPEHPLVSVINIESVKRPLDHRLAVGIFDFYLIALKRSCNAKFKYGQQEYDFDEGMMFFVAPNQIFGMEHDQREKVKSSGWILLIHPDFIWKTSLAGKIRQYEYFGYSVNEALFLSKKEEEVITAIIQNIRREYHSNTDKFSQNIIISQIETLLNYSDRFYERQFITRKVTNHEILSRLENLLEDYFNKGDAGINGLPGVQFVAGELNISPGYLSGLLKSLTGKSTQEHIHEKLIEKAKEKLSTTGLSVSEIAYELGFEHSQSFSKLFKSKTKQSPMEFRAAFD